MNDSERSMTKTRAAGLVFMAGLLINLISSFLYPGGPLIEYTDQSDFAAAIAVLEDYAILGHVGTMATIIGVLMMMAGLVRLVSLGESNWVLGRPVLRVAIIFTLFEWSLVVFGAAQRHVLIHLLQRGNESGVSADMAASFDALALGAYVDMIGALLAFLLVMPFGSFLLGLALVSYLKDMDVYKIAAYVLMLVGAVGFVVIMTSMLVPDLDIQMLLTINNVNLMIGTVALFIIGLGMFTGKSELQSEE